MTLRRTIYSQKIMPYVFMLPFVLMFFFFFLGPIIGVFGISIMKWNGLSSPVFIGFDNYLNLFHDKRFWRAFLNTLEFSIVYNIIMITISLALALILGSKQIPGCHFFRASYFAPVTMSLAVVALVFDIILAKNGLMNLILQKIGIHSSVAWLWEARYAMWAIMLMRLWRAVGYYATMLIAGLQTISSEVVEAAQMDGATSWQIVRYITIPLLKPMVLFVLVTSTIWSLQLFDEPWILNRGGPNDSTLTMAQLLYQNGFEFFRLGYSSAITVILVSMILVVSLFQVRVFRTEIID